MVIAKEDFCLAKFPVIEL